MKDFELSSFMNVVLIISHFIKFHLTITNLIMIVMII